MVYIIKQGEFEIDKRNAKKRISYVNIGKLIGPKNRSETSSKSTSFNLPSKVGNFENLKLAILGTG